MLFEWDKTKEAENIAKHGVTFETAQKAFFEENRITAIDDEHSSKIETRYFCFGRVDNRVLTVRFTIRADRIRIFGAGYWRKGKKFYEKQNRIQ